MEKELKEKPEVTIGCGNDWAKLSKPDKPLTVGIDGGYVRNWHEKNSNFEVVAGKSLSEGKEAKRFGFVQKYDDNPRRLTENRSLLGILPALQTYLFVE